MKRITAIEFCIVVFIIGILLYLGFEGWYPVYKNRIDAVKLIKEMQKQEALKYKPVGDYIADNYHKLKGSAI